MAKHGIRARLRPWSPRGVEGSTPSDRTTGPPRAWHPSNPAGRWRRTAEPGNAPTRGGDQDRERAGRARAVRKHGNAGSTPTSRPWGCSSEGKSGALAKHRTGFESPLLHHAGVGEPGVPTAPSRRRPRVQIPPSVPAWKVGRAAYGTVLLRRIGFPTGVRIPHLPPRRRSSDGQSAELITRRPGVRLPSATRSTIALVAQRIEQRSTEPCAGGSNPLGGAQHGTTGTGPTWQGARFGSERMRVQIPRTRRSFLRFRPGGNGVYRPGGKRYIIVTIMVYLGDYRIIGNSNPIIITPGQRGCGRRVTTRRRSGGTWKGQPMGAGRGFENRWG